MNFETILTQEKSKLETMRSNNEKMKEVISKNTYNYNRMILNGIKAVQELEAKKCLKV